MVHRGRTDCRPQDAGYDEKILDVLDSHCLGLIEKGMICAGSYVLARDGRVFANRSMGKLSKKAHAKDFTPECIRPIASATKAFTGIAVMQLMEKGKVFINQTVSSILEEFNTEMHRNITIFQLLTHTSGIRSDPGTYFEPYSDELSRDSWTRENWIKKVLCGPLQYRPGTRWNYCSAGYNVLAEIVARVSDLEFDRYISENILKPLGMDSTFFFAEEDIKDRVCTVSEWNERRLEKCREDEKIYSCLGSGGLYSTVYDLSIFGRMLIAEGSWNGRRILGRKSVEAATRAQVINFPTTNWREHMFDDLYCINWGFGFEIDKFPFFSEGTYCHEGAEGCLLYMDPKEKFVFSGFFPSPEWHGESWISPLAIAWSGIL